MRVSTREKVYAGYVCGSSALKLSHAACRVLKFGAEGSHDDGHDYRGQVYYFGSFKKDSYNI
jgi:hypothetical protein